MNDQDDTKLFIPKRPDSHPSARGRPKGAVNTKPIVTRIAFEKHTVKENGEAVKRSTIDLLIHTLQQESMRGNHRAAAVRDKHFGRFMELEKNEGSSSGVLLVPDKVSPEEWLKNAKRHNAKLDELMQEIAEEEAGKS